MLLPPVRAERPQPQCLQLDESSGILLIIEAAIILEGGNLLVVEAVWGLATHYNDIALHDITGAFNQGTWL